MNVVFAVVGVDANPNEHVVNIVQSVRVAGHITFDQNTTAISRYVIHPRFVKKGDLMCITISKAGCQTYSHHNNDLSKLLFLVEIRSIVKARCDQSEAPGAGCYSIEAKILKVKLDCTAACFGQCCERHFLKLGYFKRDLEDRIKHSETLMTLRTAMGNGSMGWIRIFDTRIPYMWFSGVEFTASTKGINFIRYIKMIQNIVLHYLNDEYFAEFIIAYLLVDYKRFLIN